MSDDESQNLIKLYDDHENSVEIRSQLELLICKQISNNTLSSFDQFQNNNLDIVTDKIDEYVANIAFKYLYDPKKIDTGVIFYLFIMLNTFSSVEKEFMNSNIDVQMRLMDILFSKRKKYYHQLAVERTIGGKRSRWRRGKVAL